MIRQFLHHLTHEHSYAEKDGAIVCMYRRYFSKRVTVTFQPWPGALWEPIGSDAELAERLGIDMPANSEE